MDNEPIFIRQCRKPKTNDERDTWFHTMADLAKAAGCTWCRFTFHPDDENRTLVEGWRLRPRKEGAHRWQVSERDPVSA